MFGRGCGGWTLACRGQAICFAIELAFYITIYTRLNPVLVRSIIRVGLLHPECYYLRKFIVIRAILCTYPLDTVSILIDLK